MQKGSWCVHMWVVSCDRTVVISALLLIFLFLLLFSFMFLALLNGSLHNPAFYLSCLMRLVWSSFLGELTVPKGVGAWRSGWELELRDFLPLPGFPVSCWRTADSLVTWAHSVTDVLWATECSRVIWAFPEPEDFVKYVWLLSMVQFTASDLEGLRN